MGEVGGLGGGGGGGGLGGGERGTNISFFSRKGVSKMRVFHFKAFISVLNYLAG